jgi:peptide/nickel transport system ATP-binding protein
VTNLPEASPLLAVRNLTITPRRGNFPVVTNVGFSIAPGERVGVVGESGCGKTVTGLAILGLLPSTVMRVTGEIVFDGRNLVTQPEAKMQRIRGRRIAMIFQEPMTALDAVFTVGDQISETLRAHFPLSRSAARDRAVALLDSVGIPMPRRRYDDYPHQLSGGMRQRAMIAIALACEPDLLVADEPTTALDVTVQAQIIDLLLDRTVQSGSALLFITHDLGVVAEACTRLLTMYAGQIVEDAPTGQALRRPRHPYTSGLLTSLPRLSPHKSRLPAIGGRVPPPDGMPPGCRFELRCPHAAHGCDQPQHLVAHHGHAARCHRQDELGLRGAAA